MPQTIKYALSRREVLELLQTKAEEEMAFKFHPREIRADKRFPATPILLALFDMPFDDILRAAGLYPTKPTREELIWSLRRFYIQNDRSPTVRDVDEGALPYSANLYAKHFGSWNKSLMTAGLPHRRASGGWKSHMHDLDTVSNEEILLELSTCFSETKALPSMHDYDVGYETGRYKYPKALILNRFNQWGKAAELSGLELQSQILVPPVVSDDDLLLYLMVRYEATGILPTIKSYKASNPKYSPVTYLNRFGGWKKVAELTGLKLGEPKTDNHYSNDNILLYLMLRYEDTGLLPPAAAYKASKPRYSYELYIKRFGRWSVVAELAGLKLESQASAKLKAAERAAA